jgi:choline kinase
MKSVILAAGISARLRPLTDDTPKCLLRIGGKTILERTVGNLLAADLHDIVIVTGYFQERIRIFMAERFPRLQVTYLFNERYETTNNIYSLWMTKDVIGNDGMLLLDSDILFDKAILGLLLRSEYRDGLALRTDHQLGDEEIKVRVRPDRSIAEIGKTVDARTAAGESIGIERFGAGFTSKLFAILDRKIRERNEVGVFYEAAFQEAIDEGEKIYAVDIGALKCIELDYAEDIDRAARDVIRFLD